MFEEFLGGWYEKLKAEETTTMTVKIQKDIDKYKNSAFLMISSLAPRTWPKLSFSKVVPRGICKRRNSSNQWS
jgi:hypothetical protein